MKIKEKILFFISVIAVIGGIILNFPEFINDYRPVNLKNVTVTLAYITIWIFVFGIGIKNRYLGIIKLYSVFWITTLIFAILTVIINAAEVNAGGAIPLVLLFLSQWYGLKFFAGGSVNTCIIIAFISLLVVTIAFISIQKNKSNQL